MFDNAKDSGSRLPKPLKTSQHLIDSVFQKADEALKGAESRPTAQKGGAHAPQSCFTNKQFLIRYLNEG